MPFQLTEPTKVSITKTNTRTEIHGEDRVRAIDICFKLEGSNELLDLIQPGLRQHHFHSKALDAKQDSLPDVLVPLPDLRFPNLPRSYAYTLGSTGKLRGYRFVWDFDVEESHVDFTDVALSKLTYEIEDDPGRCTIFGTIQYNGEELEDNEMYGELSGLGADGDIYIKLIAPGELLPAKKGYRAGRPDTPQGEVVPDGQGELGDVEEDADADGDDEPLDQSTPEGAFAATAEGGGE
jgi:hypothetical protein